MFETPMASVALKTILEKAWSGVRMSRSNLRYLLRIDEHSLFSKYIRQSAAMLTRLWTENSAAILGSIGIEISPCPGGCRFCSFGYEHTDFEPYRMDKATLAHKIQEFCAHDDVYGITLVTMHNYDQDFLLEMTRCALDTVPHGTQVWLNIGDSGPDFLQEAAAMGVEGIYHVCRLREGTDTELRPEDRIATMRHAKEAGLKVFTCCEPIGPEHTVDELVDSVFLAIDLELDINAAMPRVAVPGSPMAHLGTISQERLAHIVACITLAFCNVGHPFMMVHEPSLPGLQCGANLIMAESGSNPRDSAQDTSGHRGMDMAQCRQMLFDAGFDFLRRGNMKKIPLTAEYLKQCAD